MGDLWGPAAVERVDPGRLRCLCGAPAAAINWGDPMMHMLGPAAVQGCAVLFC